MTDTQRAKDYLSRVRGVDREIDAKLEIVHMYRTKLLTVKIPTLSDMNVQESQMTTNEDRIIKYIEMEENVNAMIDSLVDMREQVFSEINALSDGTSRTILIRRYIINETWEEIAEATNYSKQHVTRLHGTALEAFAKHHPDKI